MKQTLLDLADFLRARRHNVVRKVTVVTELSDPTYGPQAGTEDIDVVDFDALLDEIDAFALGFEK